MDANKTRSLAKKLVQVMKECSYVQKDAKNEFKAYKYATAAGVLEKVNESLSKHGIATVTNTEVIQSSFDANQRYVAVKTEITLIDCDSDETYKICGIGAESGDKAIARAQTMAIKYAWLMSLNISTGDDPENEEAPKDVPFKKEMNGYGSSYHPHEPNYESQNGHSSQAIKISSEAQSYKNSYNGANTPQEYWNTFHLVKAKWNQLTKEEKQAITVASTNAQNRIGIERKSN